MSKLNINLELTELEFLYQDINYYVLEKDLINIVKEQYNSNINTIKNKIIHRLNKQYHNLTVLNSDQLNEINKYKTMINKNIISWNKYKSYTNDYEYIYNSKANNMSISKIKPLSRSYFKMIEMANIYARDKLISHNGNGINTLHLAEGPGGFIEAVKDLRQNKKDNYYGISLKTAENIPGWDKSVEFLKRNPTVKIITAADGTGDITKINNIRYLHSRMKNAKIGLITADGGFNFSDNQYIQEYNAALLIYSELLCALGCLSKGGIYIYKIYDMNYKITADILYITKCFFEEVEFYKPLTSRSGNSEKYIICKDFKGISKDKLDKLINILEQWHEINNTNDKIIFEFMKNKIYYEKNNCNINEIKVIDNINCFTDKQCFYDKIISLNKMFNEQQIENIKLTLNTPKDDKWFSTRKEIQYKKAKEWCLTHMNFSL